MKRKKEKIFPSSCNKKRAPFINKVNREESDVERCITAVVPLPGSETAKWDNWILQMAEGSTQALSQLYEETHTALYGFSLSIMKNRQDAEDVLQDVYVRAFQSAGQYHAAGKPMAWLLTITRNLALMKHREQKRVIPMSPEDWQQQFADRPAVDQEDTLMLQSLLSQLSDEERQIVTLHALTGCKHREIATVLNIPLSTVLSKYRRALRKLEKALEEEKV